MWFLSNFNSAHRTATPSQQQSGYFPVNQCTQAYTCPRDIFPFFSLSLSLSHPRADAVAAPVEDSVTAPATRMPPLCFLSITLNPSISAYFLHSQVQEWQSERVVSRKVIPTVPPPDTEALITSTQAAVAAFESPMTRPSKDNTLQIQPDQVEQCENVQLVRKQRAPINVTAASIAAPTASVVAIELLYRIGDIQPYRQRERPKTASTTDAKVSTAIDECFFVGELERALPGEFYQPHLVKSVFTSSRDIEADIRFSTQNSASIFNSKLCDFSYHFQNGIFDFATLKASTGAATITSTAAVLAHALKRTSLVASSSDLEKPFSCVASLLSVYSMVWKLLFLTVYHWLVYSLGPEMWHSLLDYYFVRHFRELRMGYQMVFLIPQAEVTQGIEIFTGFVLILVILLWNRYTAKRNADTLSTAKSREHEMVSIHFMIFCFMF